VSERDKLIKVKGWQNDNYRGEVKNWENSLSQVHFVFSQQRHQSYTYYLVNDTNSTSLFLVSERRKELKREKSSLPSTRIRRTWWLKTTVCCGLDGDV